jgi:hypothetical protein
MPQDAMALLVAWVQRTWGSLLELRNQTLRQPLLPSAVAVRRRRREPDGAAPREY